MATFFDSSTIAGWFDDGQLLRAYLGDRSRHAVTASGFGSSVAGLVSHQDNKWPPADALRCLRQVSSAIRPSPVA